MTYLNFMFIFELSCYKRVIFSVGKNPVCLLVLTMTLDMTVVVTLVKLITNIGCTVLHLHYS